jgi:TonB family protein
MRTTLCSIILLAASVALANKPPQAANPLLFTPVQVAQISLFTPLPKYPLEARQRHLTGSGIFRLRVQFDTGQVRSVEIEKSTGHALLDDTAKETLRRWRFKPAALRKYLEPHDKPNEVILHMPVNFSDAQNGPGDTGMGKDGLGIMKSRDR